MTLRERWEATCADVADICRSCGRDPREVTVVAVSKTVGVETVAEAFEAGVRDFGENRTQPFAEKQAGFPQAHWHFIGQLQSRKAKEVVGRAHLIHSLDRPSLLAALQKGAAQLDVVQDVLVEVSVSGEESKAGIAPAELPALLEQLAACANVRCRGLMTMAPRGNMDTARRVFAGLRELAQACAERYGTRDSIGMDVLSMGMSEDYPAAIREGATMVRIGRRIFSEEFRRCAGS